MGNSSQYFGTVLVSPHYFPSWRKEEHLLELSPYFSDLVEAEYDP